MAYLLSGADQQSANDKDQPNEGSEAPGAHVPDIGRESSGAAGHAGRVVQVEG